MQTSWFKVIQLVVLGIFITSISDLRRKPGMIPLPLVNRKLTLFVRFSYFIPIGTYGYVLSGLNHILKSDYIGLSLTLLGVFLTMKSKIDLAEYHTWAGYVFHETQLVTSGIYHYLRHPLYTGIYIFIAGSVVTIIPHAPWKLTIIVLLSLAYIMPFLAMVARKETLFLQQLFGKKFLVYQSQVRAFIPIRKQFNSET